MLGMNIIIIYSLLYLKEIEVLIFKWKYIFIKKNLVLERFMVEFYEIFNRLFILIFYISF